MATNDSAQSALVAFREWLKVRDIDAFVFTVADRFQGEEIQPCDRFLEHLTGFPGSAGASVVTADGGALLVDGRYAIKGQEVATASGLDLVELKPGALTDVLKASVPHHGSWSALSDVLPFSSLSALIEEIPGFKSSVSADMQDWWATRPSENFVPVEAASPLASARSTTEKTALVLEEIGRVKPQTGCLVVVDPAEIAWLLNLRGMDTEKLTTFRARLVVKKRGGLMLFANHLHAIEQAIPVETAQLLEVKGEGELEPYLSSMSGTVWMSGQATPYKIVDAVHPESRFLGTSPLQLLKAVKDDSELDSMEVNHWLDAQAMVRFLFWLDQTVPTGEVDELSAAEKLWQLRRDVGAQSVSFDTISAVGPNAALPHYRSSAETNRPLTMDQVYLVDSGGQYGSAGTTDITRTLFFGEPPAELVRQNTLVLMGHIDLVRIQFPQGTTGLQLDTLARQHLWLAGLNFGHGTGHGVGAGLNVHESPPTIAARLTDGTKQAFLPGMVVSNEPGYYQAGSHGIRIECLQFCAVVPEKPGWLFFKNLCMVPYQSKLVAPELMTQDQLDWYNSYHAKVLVHFETRLTEPDDQPVLEWLREACKPLQKP